MEFAKIYKGRLPNASKTLDRKILVAPIHEQIQSPQAREAFSRLLVLKELNFWDFGVRATPQISIGDSVKIICGTTCYSGQVIDKLEDPSGEIGDLFGWSRQFKAPFRNICALDIYSTRDINSIEVGILIDSSAEIVDSFYSISADINEPESTERHLVTTYRVLRDTALARRIKADMNYTCQLCGERIVLGDGSLYAEAHHVRPLGAPHNGPDHPGNIVCLCPNCHVKLDYGVIEADKTKLANVLPEFISYHNDVIYKKA